MFVTFLNASIKIRKLLLLKRLFSNWVAVIMNLYLKRSLITCVTRNAHSYQVENTLLPLLLTRSKELHFLVEDCLMDPNFLHFVYRGIKIKMQLRENEQNKLSGDISGIFLNEDYGRLYPLNHYIIDIGANIADSSIYLAFCGARKVVGLEPYPYMYKLATKNVELNQLKDRITIYKGGYGKSGKAKVSIGETDWGTDIHDVSDGETIRIYSLQELLSLVNEPNTDLLMKMDCEGCEYNLIDESVDLLRRFKRVVIEYHYGPNALIRKFQEAGFKVDFTKPISGYNESASNPYMLQGLIYAERL